MTQFVVLDKLVAFLHYERQRNNDELKTHPSAYQEWEEYISRLKEQGEDGYCFGLSVVHAIKGQGEAEVLDWWEQVLIDIATWDENPESLAQLKSLTMIPKKFGPMTGSDI